MEATEQPRDPGYGSAVTHGAAHLETDDRQKPEEPFPKRPFVCSFCRDPGRRRHYLSNYPVRDPITSATIAYVLICDECVAKAAQSLARRRPRQAR